MHLPGRELLPFRAICEAQGHHQQHIPGTGQAEAQQHSQAWLRLPQPHLSVSITRIFNAPASTCSHYSPHKKTQHTPRNVQWPGEALPCARMGVRGRDAPAQLPFSHTSNGYRKPLLHLNSFTPLQKFIVSSYHVSA